MRICKTGILLLLIGCETETPEEAALTGNAPPELLALSWSADAVTTNDTISIQVSARDPEGANVDLIIEWTVNGVPVNATGITLDGVQHFNRNDVIAVTVTPDDGTQTGEPWHLEPLVVGNTPPMVLSATVIPEEPIASIDPLLCLANAFDPDGDPTELRFSWLQDGVEIGTEPVLLPDEIRAGEISCEVWAVDDAASGEPTDVWINPRAPTPADLDPYVEPVVTITPEDLVGAESVVVHYSGALSEGNAVTLRYGVDGYYEHADIELEQLTNDLIFTRDVEMSWTGDGWQVELELPEDITALHMAFVDGDEQIDNQDEQDYHRSKVFPIIPPYLTWDDSVTPSDGIIVSFGTDIPCLGVVSYGTDPDNLDTLLVGEVFDILHHIPLVDLEPETTYYYTVHDSAGHTSPVYHFTTTPESFSAFTLLVMADLQDNGTEDERWPEIANIIVDSHPELDLILMPGDMTADDYPGYWWRLFEGGRSLFPYVPMLPVLGNHETPTGKSNSDYSSYARYFQLPQAPANEAYYAQTYGNTRFLNFNSEIPEQFGESGAQMAWAQEETAMLWDGPDAVYDWVFASWHSPVYNVGKRFAPEQYKFRPVTELFDGNVDWVFTGHEQLYQRINPVQFSGVLAPSGSYGVMGDDGVGYMVLPAAGNHLWDRVISESEAGGEVRDLLAYPILADGQIEVDVEHGYVTVDIDGRTMEMQVWGVGNADIPLDLHVMDTVTYTKP